MRVQRFDSCVDGASVGYNRLKIFDADDYMEFFFNRELAEFQGIYRNCSVQRLL
jgi:hypothetical protein